MRLMKSNRNLCEDLDRMKVLTSRSVFLVCAFDIDLKPDVDPQGSMASDMAGYVNDYISPRDP